MEDFGDLELLVYLHEDSEKRGELPVALFSPRDRKFSGAWLATDALGIAIDSATMGGLYLAAVNGTHSWDEKPGAKYLWWQPASGSRRAWMVTKQEAVRLLQAAGLNLLRISFLRLKIRDMNLSLQAPDDQRPHKLPNIPIEEYSHVERDWENDLIEELQSLQEALETVLHPEGRHSLDFRSVHWFGADHVFTATQAACIKVLWEAWQNGTPDVGQETVIDKAGAETKRLDHVFRAHPAFGTMIVQGGTKGTFRLNPPA